MAFGATASLVELQTALDAKTATITANKVAGRKDGGPTLRLASLAAGAALLTRSIAWTQPDDQELRSMFVHVTDGTAGRVIKATLTVDGSDTLSLLARYLIDQSLSVSVTTIIGTADARADFRTTTGKRVRLLKGVRYRLDLNNTTGATTVAGPLQAGVQVRSVRRGGRAMPALVPNAFHDGGNLDVDKLNDNLRQIAADVADSVNQRWTYSVAFYDLAGITDTDVAALRQIPIRRSAAGAALEVVAVELVGTDVDVSTWTLSIPADPTFPTIAITGAGAGVEVYNETSIGTGIPSNAADTVFRLDASTATGAKINAGYLVVHFRCSRNDQGTANPGYTPTLFDATTTPDAATLQAQIDAIAAAVTSDTAVDHDLRVECYMARALTAGSTVTWRTQGGGRRQLAALCYNVGQAVGAGRKVTFNIDAATQSVVGPGAGVVSETTKVLAASSGVDPLDSASDTVISIVAAVVDCPLAILWLIWS